MSGEEIPNGHKKVAVETENPTRNKTDDVLTYKTRNIIVCMSPATSKLPIMMINETVRIEPRKKREEEEYKCNVSNTFGQFRIPMIVEEENE